MPNYVGNEPLLGVNSRDRFTGDNLTTTFTLSRQPAGSDGILVTVSGVPQDSNTYSVVGKSLVFQDAPPAAVPGQNAQNIEVIFLSRIGAPYTANWSIPIADNSGTGDALLASFNPALTALTDNLVVKIVLPTGMTNTSTTPTLNANGLGAYTIVDNDGSTVTPGLLRGTIELRYEASNLTWRLLSKVKSLASGGILTYTGSASVGSHAVNATVLGSSLSAFTLTLPLAGSVEPGDTLEFLNINTGTITVQRGGGDGLYGNSGSVSSFALGNGDTLVLRSDGSSKWYVTGGTAQLSLANVFGKSLASTGYQKLPGGLILQWGTIASGGVSDGTVTFPIAFPGSCFNVVFGVNSAGLITCTGTFTSTQLFYARRNATGGSSVPDTSASSWLAIGY